MERSSAAVVAPSRTRTRARDALAKQHNWLQLGKFCLVGGSGYVINLAVFAALVTTIELDYRPAAVASFLVAVTNNYTWNRLWTFRGSRGHVAYQGMRFLVVSMVALGANVLILTGLV